METQQFKRRPIYVDAVRVTEENFTEVAQWCQGGIVKKHETTLDTLKDDKTKHIKVRVINPQRVRQTKAFVGDWILYSEYNGYKVYTDGAFRNAFEEVLSVEEAVEAARKLEEERTPAQNVVEISDERVPDGTYGGAR
jgi:hypothetical protein